MRCYNHFFWFWFSKNLVLIFPVAQMIKNLPAMQETQVRSLGLEDPLEKGMAVHSSILAWRIPWTEEPGGLQSVGLQRIRHNWVTNTITTIPITFSSPCWARAKSLWQVVFASNETLNSSLMVQLIFDSALGWVIRSEMPASGPIGW